MTKLRAAFIGAGMMANKAHYPAVAALEDVEVVAICDLDATRREETADQYGIKDRYDDYRAIVDRQDIDVVYAILPPVPLERIVIDCLLSGKHVFTEKPPADNLAAVRRMAEAARRSGSLSMTGYNRRFCPAIRLARQRVEAQGPITLITGEYHKPQLHRKPGWGASSWLIADVVHAIDTVRWLGGPVAAVWALARTDFDDPWVNRAAALIDFAGGATGTISSSYASGNRVERFEIHGQGIAAHIEGVPGKVWPPTARILRSDTSEVEVLDPATVAGSDDFVYAYGFWHEHRSFVDCVKTGTVPEPNLDYSVDLMELMTTIEAGTTRVPAIAPADGARHEPTAGREVVTASAGAR
ncbi:MAG: Gfo/Idh/MocA family oxidoreductase [Chloroflexi bacterium]|nr:Gfo/Idh/MocA family oxidoreductase [Chloroflexota bacterium]